MRPGPLREKLIAHDLGLDDLSLELLKIALMREVDGLPLADETELRLIGGDDAVLNFAWLVARSERRLTGLDVPRDIYDAVAGDADAWAVLRGQLTGHLMVDLRRLVMGPA